MTEHERALMEAHRISSLDAHMEARPQIDNADRRKVFEAGHDAGWKNCADHLATENAELKQKLAAARKSIDVLTAEHLKGGQILRKKIEALQLRVARLVGACTKAETAFVTQVGADYNAAIHSACMACRQALSSEYDPQWLREKQAEAVDELKRRMEADGAHIDELSTAQDYADELRQQKEG